MAQVAVWSHRLIRGWEGEWPPADVPMTPIVELVEALTAEYPDDAHFVPYWCEGEEAQPRLNKAAFDVVFEQGGRILFDVLVADVDDKAAHAGDGEASEAWRESFLEAFDRSRLRDCAGLYMTRGGARILWRLPEPVERAEYLGKLAAVYAELAQVGIVADHFFDWGRCYRLPFVARDGVVQTLWHDLSGLAEGALDIAAALVPTPARFSGVARAGQGRQLPDVISENRNQTLTSYAGSYRAKGLEADALLLLLRGVNETRCEPPLPDHEIEHIARSVARYALPPAVVKAAAAPAGVYQTLDDGRVYRFELGSQVEIAAHAVRDVEGEGEELRADRGAVHKYDETLGIWSELPAVDVRCVVAGYDGELVKGAWDDRKAEFKLGRLKVSAALTRDCYQLVCDGRDAAGFFDDALAGLTFANGFVQVSLAGVVSTVPYDAGQRSMARVDVDFVPGAVPRRFLAALRACWRDDADCDAKIATLRAFVGLCLLGRVTRMQRGVIMLGGGANGKSMVQDVVASLFPPASVAAVTPQDLADQYRRARLSTAKINIVSELPEAEILASEAVKAFLSGDVVEARHIRCDPFEYRPAAGHLFSANALPGVRDTSHGFWRRWIVLTFNREFAVHEQVKGLAGEIVASELGELASWAVEGGALALAAGRYPELASSDAALAEWRAHADQVLAYLDECTESGDLDGAWTPAGELYVNYKYWAERNGHGRMSSTMLGKRLRQIGVATKRTSSATAYAVTLRAAKKTGPRLV
jgi:P4 family phage/plasmid primase-like protien